MSCYEKLMDQSLDSILRSAQISLEELVKAIKKDKPMLLQTRPQTLNRFKGLTLKEYRVSILKVSQTTLAQMINDELIHWGIEDQGMISQYSISHWENGNKLMEYSPRKSWIIRNVYGLTDDEWVEMIDYTKSNEQKDEDDQNMLT